MKGLFDNFVILGILHTGYAASSPSDIVNAARSYIGSERWLITADHPVGGSNTNKDYLFVADVLKQVEADAPNLYWFEYSPIGADEWADRYSGVLLSNACWEPCSVSYPKGGDVIAEDGKVGIVTEDRTVDRNSGKTTRANINANPRGLDRK